MNKPNIRVSSISPEYIHADNNVYDCDGDLIGNVNDCVLVSWWGRHCEDCDIEKMSRVILKEDLDTFNPND